MIQFLYRWFCGYLRVILTGRRAGRFLNLCSKNGMHLWKINSEKEVDTYQFYIFLKDFVRIRPLCRKTHTKLRIKSRYGFPFLISFYKKRIVFPIAFLIVSGFIWFCSGYIWKIEIIGNSFVSEDTIIRYLEENNAGFGTKKGIIDTTALELSLREDFPQIIWASSYIEGTKLVVEVQESIKTNNQNDMLSDEICTDLVATKDAVVASIITRNGDPYVKAGDSVTAGSILVCGRQEILADSGEVKEYFYQSADADIYGFVTYEYNDYIEINCVEERETGKKKNVFFIEFFGKRLETPLLGKEYKKSEVLESYQQLQISSNFYLPIFIGKKEYNEQENVNIEHTLAEAKAIAEENLKIFLEDLEENGVSIIDKNVMIEKMGNHYRVYGTIDVCEPIARTAPTEILDIQEEGTKIDGNE